MLKPDRKILLRGKGADRMIKRLQIGDKVYDISILDDIYVDLHMAGKKDGKVIRSDRYSVRDLLLLLDLARSNIYEEGNED